MIPDSDYSGIIDQPAPGNHRDRSGGSGTVILTGDDSSAGITRFATDMLERGLPCESRSFCSELDTPEELHAAQGVSGHSYAMVDKRVPDRLRGRGRENVQDRGRSPARR